MNVAVFLPNWVGDAVMATPTLRALRGLAGVRGRLVSVLRPHIAEVLAGVDSIDEQILFDPHARDRELGSLSVIKQLRASSPDAIVLLTNSLRTGLVAWATGASERVGYARYGRGMLLTTKLHPPRRGRKRIPTPAIDSYLQLAYAIGAAAQTPRLDLEGHVDMRTGCDDSTVPGCSRVARRAMRILSLPSGPPVAPQLRPQIAHSTAPRCPYVGCQCRPNDQP